MTELLRDVREFRDISSHIDLPSEYVEGIKQCVQSAFGGGVTSEDTLAHLQGNQVLVALDTITDAPEVVGFSATSILSDEKMVAERFAIPHSYAYFAAAAIAKSHQGNGLYAQLNDRRLDFVEASGLGEIYTRTQNPRVEQGITQALERMVEARRIRAFTIARQVIQGVYGGMLTDTKPMARLVSYDNIDYARGDANLIKWQLLT